MQRVMSKVRKKQGCWEWTAAKMKDGRGKVWFRGSLQFAHRAV
jgi:hypothetical protein